MYDIDNKQEGQTNTHLTMQLQTPSLILRQGLRVLGIRSQGRTNEAQTHDFHKHFGSKPLDMADMWYDLTTTTIPGAALTLEEKSAAGLKRFCIAHHFLWTYPKNVNIMASRFKICEKYARGQKLWDWVAKIGALHAKKIGWLPRLNDPNSETFILTVDGTDFRMWERKHPTLNIDRSQCSHKFKHGAVKYEIAVSTYLSKICWISGPHAGGKHDLTIFREGLKQKIAPGKKVHADRGYESNFADESMLSTPNTLDSKGCHNFKSRSRLRLETLNGRLKKYECLNQTFRHGQEKQSLAFQAVIVTIQYHMDNGSELFKI
jgi:hypothetical protein